MSLRPALRAERIGLFGPWWRTTAMDYPAIMPFETKGATALSQGADALRYVMANGHAVTVPTDVLHFAERVGVLSIARREDELATVVAEVNRALDVIAATLRIRARLDADGVTEPIGRSPHQADAGGGHALRVVPPAPTRPPEGSALMPRVDDAAIAF
jgi:hypothetical protein